ncbi:MAG TPA: hypothetical protein VEK79_21890 [Thermoanaerobaculia bacterium]|nr:hypothetical protein [Thermoanaerobaculia bacterium]
MTHQFLREPALFPARMAGETWGSERCDVELAGELFRIEGLSSLQLRGLAERYGARLQPSHATNVAATLQVFRAPVSDFVEIDTRGWEYWVDLQWSESGFALSGMRVMARAELDRAGIWTSVEEPAEFSGVVENVLRPLLAARLLANGGLLVHSAAADGYLFAGRSGAGKSTVARLALDAGRAVLSDDLNAIMRVDASAERRRGTPALPSGFLLEPLPFTGDLEERETSRTQTRLRAILALEKSDAESVRAMSLADTVSLLVRCAPYVNQDPARLPLLLERASEIAHGTRRGVIAFRRDGDVWPILDAGFGSR